MKALNYDQSIFVPVTDETKGGATYEVRMTIQEIFDNFFGGNTPEIIDAEPVTRCKDCPRCYFASNRVPAEQSWVCGKHGIDVTPEFFCADGARREQTCPNS